MGTRGILLVEDDAVIRENLAALLEDEGYRVTTAANGVEALQALNAGGPPCVIVLDLMMPVMTGWELRAHLLQDAKLADIPVIVVSAVDNLASHARALSAAAYVAKPIELDQFLSSVQRHC